MSEEATSHQILQNDEPSKGVNPPNLLRYCRGAHNTADKLFTRNERGLVALGGFCYQKLGIGATDSPNNLKFRITRQYDNMSYLDHAPQWEKAICQRLR